jgi:hypothetical protein
MGEADNQRVSELDYNQIKDGEVIEENIESTNLKQTEDPRSNVSNATSTYIEIVSEKDDAGQPISILEVDLVISREKGKETRRLSLNFAGIDLEEQKMIEKSVNIDRDNFERLKSFFCNLDWNS